MPEDYAALIRQCWTQDPKQRPNAGEVKRQLKHIVNEQMVQECSVEYTAM